MCSLKSFCRLLSPDIKVIIYKNIPPCDDRLFIYEGFVIDIPDNLKNDWVHSFFLDEGILYIEISKEFASL